MHDGPIGIQCRGQPLGDMEQIQVILARAGQDQQARPRRWRLAQGLGERTISPVALGRRVLQIRVQFRPCALDP